MVTMPCGAIVSYGPDNTYEHAYIVTTKSIRRLDPVGDKLYPATPETMTKSMMAVQSKMNEITRLRYSNVYRFIPGVQTLTLNHDAEINTMNAKTFPITRSFGSVIDVLNDEYPLGYTYTTFRTNV